MQLLTSLLPHQVPAVEKLAPLRVGALFMDMGTGKSRVTIELAARRPRATRLVWFCPVSLKETVRREIEKHTGQTVASGDVHVFGDKTRPQNIPQTCYWYVVGIESMSQSKRVLTSAASLINQTTMVVVDESEKIKGHLATRTKWITYIAAQARYRLILTGTPDRKSVV